MKKRTLNQTWILCLRMWRWISKVWVKGACVHELKLQWLRENGFVAADIYCNCFFCDWAGAGCCTTRCPGKLVDYKFSCRNRLASYELDPKAFYKELLRLNRIRKGKK